MAVSNGHTSSDELRRAYEDCLRTDNLKNSLVQHMLEEIASLESSLALQATKIEHQGELVTLYHAKFKESESELTAIKRKQDQANFSLVLIDGDIMLFQDEYLKKGEQGGTEAARELRNATEDYLAGKGIPSDRILVRIYANVSGLKKVYGPVDIHGFIQGFNMFDGLYEIVDAGYGKECSDEKVKKTFEVFIRTLQCNHIIFGGSGDNGYARLLGSYTRDEKITLLEGPPFGRELAAIAKEFQQTKFKNVFRNTKIELPIRAITNFPPPELAPVRAIPAEEVQSPVPSHIKTEKEALPIPSSVEPVPTTWVTKTSKSLNKGSATANSSQVSAEGKPTPKKAQTYAATDGYPVLRNPRGERVDAILEIARSEVQAIKERKLCNNYHLFGSCDYGDSCYNGHGKSINEREYIAQRALARRTPCRTGLSCSDKWCTSGHCCSAGQMCIKGKCWFPSEMHDVDNRVVTTISI